MLDNMTPAQIKRVVKFKKGKVKFEVSGNISMDNVRSYALAGVDYISIGAITHSAKAVDVNMRIN
jgi:nicotinate-nucleotide pyrophosphorylase (carboxylating)